MSENSAEKDQARSRIEKVFRFLQELHKLRTPPKQELGDYDWTLSLSDLPKYPTIEIGQPPKDDESEGRNDTGDFLLRVSRPKETQCPEPPSEIVGWIENNWKSFDLDIQHITSRNFNNKDGKTYTEQFESDPNRPKAFADWKLLRDRWVEAEKPARAAAAVYSNLYKILGQIERESEKYQLYLGDGILHWESSTGSIEHPLVLLRVNLEFDSSVPQFTLTVSEHDTELYVSLLRYAQIDGKGIQRCKEKISVEQPHPLDGEPLDGILQYMVQALFEDGQFFSSATDAQGCTTPHIIRQPTFFLGLRNQGFIEAVDSFIDNLKDMTTLPQALVRVVGVELADGKSVIGDQDTREASLKAPQPASDYLLTKPANKEQERIIDRLEEAGTVLVQGPPGTGKSHTIANLIGHLLAQKKTILITSHAAKALKVVREKVVNPLQPLCVSVLDNDEESKKQLEESITGIVNYLSRTDAKKLAGEIKELSERRDFLKNRVKDLTDQLLIARGHEYNDIVIAGEATPPSRAARKIAEVKGTHDWIPSPVGHGLPVPLTAAEISELYSTNNEMTKEEENTLANTLPEMGRLPEPNDFFDHVGVKSLILIQNTVQRTDLWTHQNHAISTLEEANTSLAKTLMIFDQKISWLQECLDAGRLGGSHLERWTSLRNQIEDTSKKIAQNYNVVLEYGPSIETSNKNLNDLYKISNEIVDHLASGGKLGFVSTVFKSDWKDFVKNSTVNGITPSTTTHFKALNSLLFVMISRDDLTKRWDRQMAPLGAITKDGLGDEPERVLTGYIDKIDEALAWYEKSWTSQSETLAKLGLNLPKLFLEIPIGSDKYGELSRLKTISTIISELVSARINELKLLTIQKRENDWLTELKGFKRTDAVFDLVEKIRDGILALDHSMYSAAWKKLNSLYSLRQRFHRRCTLLAKLEIAAAGWAHAVRNRVTPHDKNVVPGDTAEAWRYIQWSSVLQERHSVDLDTLQSDLHQTKEDLQDITAQYVESLAWLAQLERTGLKQQQALTGWLGLQRRITKGGRGVRDARLRREARDLIKECKSAVPVWIMPESRAFESFDLGKVRFDVVIVDEASQSGIIGLAALALGDEVVVVGDHEQVSPYGAGIKLAPVQALIDEILSDVPNSQLYDGKLSLYDIARQSFGGTIRLVEHFHCVPDIIQFSNHLSYEGEIKPLREASSSLFEEHVIPHRVMGKATDNNVNEVEALEIASIIAAMTEFKEYSDCSIGVITLRGMDQALHIDSLLQRRIGPTLYQKHKLLCGNASQFQGDERRVMLLSMVDSCENPPLSIQQSEEYKRSFNVAASRAQDQLWLVHSLNPMTDLKPNDLRLRLIQHMQDPSALRDQLYTGEMKVDSEFERMVLHDLTNEGFRVVCQWKVGAYRIDLVAVGKNKKIAIECDGDRYHPPEKLADDISRQMVLERLGWRFIRIRGGEYFKDKTSTMKRVFRRLDELGVERLGPETSISDEGISTELRMRVLTRAAEIRRSWEENPISEALEIPQKKSFKKWGSTKKKNLDQQLGFSISSIESEIGSETEDDEEDMVVSTKSNQRRKPGAVFIRELKPSAALSKIVGEQPISREDVAKLVWAYIKKHNLQDTKNRRNINADENLKKVFGGKSQVSMFEMTKLISKHLS